MQTDKLTVSSEFRFMTNSAEQFSDKEAGDLLILGGMVYVLDNSLAIIAPSFRKSITGILLLPLSVGEISTLFYLLIKGVSSRKSNGLQTQNI